LLAGGVSFIFGGLKHGIRFFVYACTLFITYHCLGQISMQFLTHIFSIWFANKSEVIGLFNEASMKL
jgi:hypothetical protein